MTPRLAYVLRAAAAGNVRVNAFTTGLVATLVDVDASAYGADLAVDVEQLVADKLLCRPTYARFDRAARLTNAGRAALDAL